jgi:hypothetical protein
LVVKKGPKILLAAFNMDKQGVQPDLDIGKSETGPESFKDYKDFGSWIWHMG